MPLGDGRVRLAVVEGIQGSTPLDPYLALKSLARYCGYSVRWLRYRLKDPHHPLPCYQLPGSKVLVRRSEFDGWLARYRQVGSPDVNRIVNDVLSGLQ